MPVTMAKIQTFKQFKISLFKRVKKKKSKHNELRFTSSNTLVKALSLSEG